MASNITPHSVSCKAILGDVSRRFQIQNSEYLSGGLESIGHGLETIGIFSGYETKHIECIVNDFKTKIPCSVHLIQSIQTKNGQRLHPLDAIGANRSSTGSNSVTPSNINLNWYTFNPNYIQTGFEKGTIIVNADCIPLDCDGFPLVPDDPAVREALVWRVLMDVLSRGYKHPSFTFKDAFQFWELYYPRAQNSLISLPIEGMERFRKMWTSWTLNAKWDVNGRSFLDTYNSGGDGYANSYSSNG